MVLKRVHCDLDQVEDVVKDDFKTALEEIDQQLQSLACDAKIGT
jgi:hypothetical protein